MRDSSSATIDTLLGMIGSAVATDRSAALHALGNVARHSGAPIRLQRRKQEVVELLDDADENVRWSALYLLGSVSSSPEETVRLLARHLLDSSEDVRWIAVSRLKEIGPRPELVEHVPTLCGVVRGGSPPAKDACRLLAMLGVAAREAVPCLLEALRSDDGGLVVTAAEALWKIDRRVEESLPALATLRALGEEVCDAISAIGPAAAPLLQKVVEALQSDDEWDLQWAAADALGAVASSDPPVIAALAAALDHESPIVCSAAVRALARVGQAAIPTLLDLLDNDAKRAKGAAAALGRMGRLAEPAALALREKLDLADPELASWCAISLAHVAGDSCAVPWLVRLLERSGREDLRREAVGGLEAIGPPAAEARHALQSARDEADDALRADIDRALAAVNARAN